MIAAELIEACRDAREVIRRKVSLGIVDARWVTTHDNGLPLTSLYFVRRSHRDFESEPGSIPTRAMAEI